MVAVWSTFPQVFVDSCSQFSFIFPRIGCFILTLPRLNCVTEVYLRKSASLDEVAELPFYLTLSVTYVFLHKKLAL